MEARRQITLRLMNSESIFLKRVDTIYRRALDKQDKYIQATALSLLARHFIFKLFSFISQRVPMPVPDEQHPQFFNYAFQGYQLFVEIAHLKEAHVCLSNALEILYSARYYNHTGVLANSKKSTTLYITTPSIKHVPASSRRHFLHELRYFDQAELYLEDSSFFYT